MGAPSFDRKRMLTEIAADPTASHAARLRAIKLIGTERPPGRPKAPPKPDTTLERAIALMAEWHGASDSMPAQGTHRSIPIHCYQSADRIRRVVLPQLDRILDGPAAPVLLAEVCVDLQMAPEVRLLSCARLSAMVELRIAMHEAKGWSNCCAAVAGLSSMLWADVRRYGSLLDVWTGSAGPGFSPVELSASASVRRRPQLGVTNRIHFCHAGNSPGHGMRHKQ
jgi:hypothetical protein